MHKIHREIILDQDNPIQKGKINPAEGSVEVSTYADIYMLDCGKALSTVDNSIQSARFCHFHFYLALP
ncbi:hypothetical protein [Photobacterium leiognathi]|uniref:hypothetical protein n=1 Tax=Photobacterium leiognathi TaxID=553611 RepID=UPI0027395D4F|nr:hypothetical protein [Photobacterium leiognathi]